MPHLPAKNFLDAETPLPEATGQSFWLKSATWQCPTFDNVESFVNRLVRQEILVHDPLVAAVLQEQPHEMAPRTLRHRFARATGLSHSHIRQQARAQRAATLLQQGVPILDTVYELGYFDQPHLTRSLKQFIGFTPAQIATQVQLPSA
jgi:methylphosphotriester-DNA--protein-cysteine methyltransferase